MLLKDFKSTLTHLSLVDKVMRGHGCPRSPRFEKASVRSEGLSHPRRKVGSPEIPGLPTVRASRSDLYDPNDSFMYFL